MGRKPLSKATVNIKLTFDEFSVALLKLLQGKRTRFSVSPVYRSEPPEGSSLPTVQNAFPLAVVYVIRRNVAKGLWYCLLLRSDPYSCGVPLSKIPDPLRTIVWICLPVAPGEARQPVQQFADGRCSPRSQLAMVLGSTPSRRASSFWVRPQRRRKATIFWPRLSGLVSSGA
jgi:hypothetical protein